MRAVFHGVGAFVGVLYSETKCKFWPDEPGRLSWDHKALVEIDLAKSPAAARAGRIPWTDVDVDDHHIYGGMTKIGPLWPDGAHVGACYVTEDAWRRGTGRALDPDPDCHDYELTHVLYWQGPLATRRFHGFHAQITSEQGARALVTLWHAGKSKAPNAPPVGTWWIDLAADAHAIEPGFTQVGVGASPKTGALFLDLRQARTLQLDDPKKPPWLGEDFFPAEVP